MKKNVQKSVSLFMIVLLVSFSFLNGNTTANAYSTSSLGVRARSQSEIISYLNAHPFSTTEKVTFSSTPSTSYPYKLGSISQSSKNNGLNALNCYRYIAGLSEVTWDSSIETGMQAACMVSALNGYTNHHPSKPALLDADIFNLGYQYCGSSNLYKGPTNLADSIPGYIADASSPSNVECVGHRRWCLNPTMEKTCFGFVYSNDSRGYTAMYAFDRGNTADSDIVNVAWPAQNTPVEYFNMFYPWSLSTGTTLNPSLVSVRLTRTSDNKTWTFSQSSTDGYFNVDNGGYGLVGCIIFQPNNITANSGDSYLVHIETGNDTIEYTVNFFKATSQGENDNPGNTDPVDPIDPSVKVDDSINIDVIDFISKLINVFIGVIQFFAKFGTWLFGIISSLAVG